MRAQNRTEMKPYERDRLGVKPEHTPENNEAIRMCVNAWYELDADRLVGLAGAGAIPFTALLAWAEAHDLDREAFEMLRGVIRVLDNDRAIAEDARRKQQQAKGRKKR